MIFKKLYYYYKDRNKNQIKMLVNQLNKQLKEQNNINK